VDILPLRPSCCSPGRPNVVASVLDTACEGPVHDADKVTELTCNPCVAIRADVQRMLMRSALCAVSSSSLGDGHSHRDLFFVKCL